MSRSFVRRTAPFWAAALLVLAGCSKQEEPAGGAPPPPKPAAKPSPAPTAVQAPAAPAGGGLDANAPILHPEKATQKAPDKYKVKFVTSKGDFVIQVVREWAPNGADRFYNLVKLNYYDGVRFFRAVEGFMVQFGIHGDPQVNAAWRPSNFPDDPVVKSNKRGFVTFAKTNAPNSRSTQVFINYADKNANLDSMGFSPFGEVVEGMNVVDSLYKGYGEGAPRSNGPDQSRFQREGNAYLEKDFPLLDYIKEARLL